MSYSAAHIRFIRDPNQDTDDRVTIRRTGVDQYELTYVTTATDSGAPNIHTLRTDDRGIFRWMRSVIRLLEADAEPFSRLQLDFPAAPSVLINVRRIGQHYNAILDALEIWLDDAETSEPPRTPPRQCTRPVTPNAPPPVRRSHHLFFDLGDD